jgi:hypothetical protein
MAANKLIKTLNGSTNNRRWRRHLAEKKLCTRCVSWDVIRGNNCMAMIDILADYQFLTTKGCRCFTNLFGLLTYFGLSTGVHRQRRTCPTLYMPHNLTLHVPYSTCMHNIMSIT